MIFWIVIQSPNYISLSFCQCCIISSLQYYTVTKSHFTYYITVTTTRDYANHAHHGASSSAVFDSTTVSNPCFLSITFLFFRDDFSIGLGILAMSLGLPRFFGAAYGGQYLYGLFFCCSLGKVFVSVSMSKYSIPESSGYCSRQQSVIHQYGMQLDMVRSTSQLLSCDDMATLEFWEMNRSNLRILTPWPPLS